MVASVRAGAEEAPLTGGEVGMVRVAPMPRTMIAWRSSTEPILLMWTLPERRPADSQPCRVSRMADPK